MENIKEMLLRSGVTEENMAVIQEKFDLEKINAIIDSAHNPKEAFEALHDLYPDFEVATMQDQMDKIQEQYEAAVKEMQENGKLELNEEELDSVVGGSWASDHWKQLTGAAVGGTIGAIIGTMGGATIGMALGPGAIVGAIVGGVGGAVFLGKIGWDAMDCAEKAKKI